MTHEAEIDKVYKPTVISKELYANVVDFELLIEDYKSATILDLFASQKKELFKIQNPGTRLAAEQLDNLYASWAAGKNPDLEGEWIYYPWSGRLLHVLSEAEFVSVRTSRNQYKITPDEQVELSGKTIGIIGLSVGNAVALSIATERVCGTLRLADFDTLELSNLNRIRTGLHNIGLNKCVVTAREIAEIDPYLNIECFTDGITNENINDFLTKNGRLDILVDECDDLEVKILCRQRARSLGIPTIMETSDRGMLDVERFDLEPERPILHGVLAGIPEEKLSNIPAADRLPLVMRIIDAPNTSKRGRLSLLEMGQTIGTWPQLASAVTLGGGVVGDTCRRMLLGSFTASGRYYVDLEQIVGNHQQAGAPAPLNPHPAFDPDRAARILDSLPSQTAAEISEDILKRLVDAAATAPSAGNDQPWKWVYRDGRLHLFNDLQRSHAFANYKQMAAMHAFGAAFDNILSESRKSGYEALLEINSSVDAPELVASISFLKIPHTPSEQNADISFDATTEVAYPALQAEAEMLEGVAVRFITDKEKIRELAAVVGECDLIMQLNTWGHFDFFERNLRWTPQQLDQTHDGVSLQSLQAGPARAMALSILRDHQISDTLKKIGGGGMLIGSRAAEIAAAESLAIVTVSNYNHAAAFQGGAAARRIDRTASRYGMSAESLMSPAYLFARLETSEALETSEIAQITRLESAYRRILDLHTKPSDTFLLKIGKRNLPEMPGKRLPLDEILFLVNKEIG